MAYCVPLGLPHSVFQSWDPLDQDKAIAWRREQSKVCRCGTRSEEWKKDKFAYVGQQRYCPGCELLEEEEKNVHSGTGGVHVYLAPAHLAKTPDEEGIER